VADERVEPTEALRASEARFRALVHHASDIVVVHRDGRFTYTSPSLTRILGWTAEELEGRPVESIVHPDDRDVLRARMAERQRGVPSTGVGRYRLRCKAGGWRTVETVSTSHSEDPAVQGVVVNARDVTEAVEAQAALRVSEARHRALVEHLSDVIVVADADGRIQYASPGIERLVGYPVEEVEGETIFNALHPADLPRGHDHLARAIAGGPGRYGPERFRYVRADGQWRHFEATASNRLDDPAVRGMVFILRDVTDQCEAEEQLRHLALHDALTGLANRTLLTDRFGAALDGGRRQGLGTALLVVDLDGFKAVNDRWGHAIGDAVLVEAAARMLAATRTVDTVGRLGGDEFAAVLPGAGTEAEEVALRVLEAIRQPIRHPGGVVEVGASIGVALAPTHGDDVGSLFRRADAAMYRAKCSRLGVATYEAGMSD
jgi:diguanylate cyclase (GGDEF)-like protein/PAS domain S-box-containing protein